MAWIMNQILINDPFGSKIYPFNYFEGQFIGKFIAVSS